MPMSAGAPDALPQAFDLAHAASVFDFLPVADVDPIQRTLRPPRWRPSKFACGPQRWRTRTARCYSPSPLSAPGRGATANKLDRRRDSVIALDELAVRSPSMRTLRPENSYSALKCGTEAIVRSGPRKPANFHKGRTWAERSDHASLDWAVGTEAIIAEAAGVAASRVNDFHG